MKKSCQLDQTLELPPVGARVLIHDDEEFGAPHPGTVCGHGQHTRAGAMVDPSTPLVPAVLVQLDRGVHLQTDFGAEPTRQRCFVHVIAVHPDNLARDEYGNFASKATPVHHVCAPCTVHTVCGVCNPHICYRP